MSIRPYLLRRALEGINLPNFEKPDELDRIWVPHAPTPQNEVSAVGIDSSWNKKDYQGGTLYALATATADIRGNHVLDPKVDEDFGLLCIRRGGTVYHSPRTWLEAKAVLNEAEMARELCSNFDIVLLDGSYFEPIYDFESERTKFGLDVFGRFPSNVIFVSKTSTSTTLFGKNMGDIQLLSEYTKDSGYTKPNNRRGITIFYSRLSRNCGCYRFEVAGELGEEEVGEYMDTLAGISADGYPIPLRFAHDNVKIGRDDIELLVDQLGLRDLSRGREALYE